MDKVNRLGIDLTGRKMHYQPWPADTEDKYKKPTEHEINETYGISGEAVNETLLYFEECGGDTKQLIQLLNDHVINSIYCTDRETLLDKSRWYNNEYYFYFIMFTKKVIGDFKWRFTKGENVQLSIYHKIYELGSLRYMPYGGNEKDDSYSVLYALIKYYITKGYDFSDFYNWAESLAKEKTTISFKNVVSKLEKYWLCSEFNNFMYEFAKIILNKNSMKTICYEAYDSYDLEGFSYVPEIMLLKIINYVTQKTTNFYKIETRQTKKNSAFFTLSVSNDYNTEKDDIYKTSIYNNANSITIAAYPQIIKKLLKLNKMPEIKSITGQETAYCTFALEWENRILSVPYLQLLIINSLFFVSLSVFYFFKLNALSFIILFFLSMNTVFMLLRRLKIEKSKRKISDENIIKVNEENSKRLEKLEELSNELMIEKEILEEKVQERTGRLAEANEKLKELDKAKTNFFSNVSHELRTPLTLLISPLTEIKKGSYGRSLDKNNPIFEMMQKNASRLLRLINNILDFTKIEEGKMKVNKEKINISEALKIYVSQIESAAKNKNLYVKLKDESGGLTAYLDQDLFETAVFNILSNALKFTDKGGITVSLAQETNGHFIIAFIDTGIGIQGDKIESIFERFHQIDEKSNRRYEGTGIGLALTREITDILGGRVSVESKLGEGSTFKLILPAINDELPGNKKTAKLKQINPVILEEFKPVKQEENNNIKPIDKRKKTVLLVEDNIELQKYLGTMLEEKYNIIFAGNGIEALKNINIIQKPALIISDLMMPEMDGMEFFKEIQKFDNYNDIPFIFLTARAGEDERIRGLKSGAIDYINKPFNIEELTAKIESIISKTKNIKDSYKNEIQKKILNLLEEETEDSSLNEIALEMKLKDYGLSSREKEIVFFLIRGEETKEIAVKLKINQHTVENHLSSIYKKTGVSNKIELFHLLRKPN